MPGFNIPTFGCDNANSNAAAMLNTFETARKHRFEVNIVGIDAVYTTAAKRIDRPSVEFENIEFNQGQDVVNRPGKNKWHPVNVELYDLLDSNSITSKACYDWMFGDAGVVNLSKSKLTSASGAYKRTVVVSLLDGYGIPVWKYTLLNAYPQKKAPSDLDFSSSDIASQLITIMYDKAIEEANSSSKSKSKTKKPNTKIV